MGTHLTGGNEGLLIGHIQGRVLVIVWGAGSGVRPGDEVFGVQEGSPGWSHGVRHAGGVTGSA